jgi:hypothetical protein
MLTEASHHPGMNFIGMTAARARKKRENPSMEHPPQKSAALSLGLWIEESLLPTNLAKKGSTEQPAFTGERFAGANKRARLLQLAEIALGCSAVSPRKKQSNFSGFELRSSSKGTRNDAE